MKFLVILLYLINGSISLYASELEIEVIGKTTRQISIDLPSGIDMYPLDMKEDLKVL